MEIGQRPLVSSSFTNYNHQADNERKKIAQSAGAVEYTDCTSAEG